MRVGVGSTGWAKGVASGRLDGIGHYAQELIKHLKPVPEVAELSPIAFGSLADQELEGATSTRLGSYEQSALWSSVTGLSFPCTRQLKRSIDIFHATDHFTPRFDHIPVVATLMDAIPLSHPQWVSQGGRVLKNWIWRKSGNWADRVITISEFSRREIAHHFGIPETRISITSLGVDERYFLRLPYETIQNTARTFSLPERYFLFVGTLQPRKNVERLLDAHECLPPEVRKDFPLVIVGNNGWGVNRLIDRLMAQDPHGPVRWLQNVDDLTKRQLMQGATALVFPSLLEGFGLPVLEGFASETPVITSNTTSLPEVAGDAAWQVDPMSVADIAEAMVTLAREENMRLDLVARGRDRARLFTWARCAEETVAVYRTVLR